MSSATVDKTPLTPALASPARPWRLAGLDGLRAMACMMVFGIHAWEFAEKPKFVFHFAGGQFEIGKTFAPFTAGVDLFMVLSGFCLFWPCCKSPDALARWEWKDYAKRRVRRIVPPYYVAIAYVLLLPMLLKVCLVAVDIVRAHAYSGAEMSTIVHSVHWDLGSTPREIITHLLFIHTFDPMSWDKVTGAFWSLGLEMQFYLMFPLILYAFRRQGLKAIWAVIAVSLLFRMAASIWYYPQYEPFLLTITFIGRWMQFGAGMLAAWIVADFYRHNKSLGPAVGNLLVAGAIGLFWLVADGVIYDQGPRWLLVFPWRDALLGLSFSMLLFAVTSTRTWIRPLFEWRPVAWIGFISYSIFLVHQSTIWYLSELLKKHWNLSGGPHLAITCTVGLAITIVVSYVFFRLFEKPFMTIPGQKEKFAAKSAAAPSHPEKLPAIVPQAGNISPVIVQAGKLAPATVSVVAPATLAESIPAPTNLN